MTNSLYPRQTTVLQSSDGLMSDEWYRHFNEVDRKLIRIGDQTYPLFPDSLPFSPIARAKRTLRLSEFLPYPYLIGNVLTAEQLTANSNAVDAWFLRCFEGSYYPHLDVIAPINRRAAVAATGGTFAMYTDGITRSGFFAQGYSQTISPREGLLDIRGFDEVYFYGDGAVFDGDYINNPGLNEVNGLYVFDFSYCHAEGNLKAQNTQHGGLHFRSTSSRADAELWLARTDVFKAQNHGTIFWDIPIWHHGEAYWDLNDIDFQVGALYSLTFNASARRGYRRYAEGRNSGDTATKTEGFDNIYFGRTRLTGTFGKDGVKCQPFNLTANPKGYIENINIDAVECPFRGAWTNQMGDGSSYCILHNARRANVGRIDIIGNDVPLATENVREVALLVNRLFSSSGWQNPRDIDVGHVSAERTRQVVQFEQVEGGRIGRVDADVNFRAASATFEFPIRLNARDVKLEQVNLNLNNETYGGVRIFEEGGFIPGRIEVQSGRILDYRVRGIWETTSNTRLIVGTGDLAVNSTTGGAVPIVGTDTHILGQGWNIGDLALTINDAAFTVIQNYDKRRIVSNRAATTATEVTLPAGFPTGWSTSITKTSSASLRFLAGAGATISTGGDFDVESTDNQPATVYIEVVGENRWHIHGDLFPLVKYINTGINTDYEIELKDNGKTLRNGNDITSNIDVDYTIPEDITLVGFKCDALQMGTGAIVFLPETADVVLRPANYKTAFQGGKATLELYRVDGAERFWTVSGNIIPV